MNKPPRRIGLNEVMHRTNLKKTAIYDRISKGIFPTRNNDGWLESDIDYYVLHGHMQPASNEPNQEAA